MKIEIKFARNYDTLYMILLALKSSKKWEEIGVKYKLQEVNWFNDMFNLRHRWVPVFFKGDFWASMSSTQRSESMNNFFKAFVNLNTTLKEFVHQYCLALGKRANEEENETFRSVNKPTLYFTEYVSESVFQRLYTSKKFEEFQGQVRMVTYTSARKVQDDERACVYEVVTKKAKWPHRQQFKVTLDKVTYDVNCECKNFEFKEILCSHVIRVYHEEDVDCVPEKYILSRWRKDLVRDHTKIVVPYYTPDKNPQAKRYFDLHKEFEDLSSMAIIGDKPYSFLMETLRGAKTQLKVLAEECQEHPQVVSTIGKVYGRHLSNAHEKEINNQDNGLNRQKKVKDPIDRRGKGKKPNKRKGYENDLHSKRRNQEHVQGQYQMNETSYPIMSQYTSSSSTAHWNQGNHPKSVMAHNPQFKMIPVVWPHTSTYGNFMTSNLPFQVTSNAETTQAMSSLNYIDPKTGGEKRFKPA